MANILPAMLLLLAIIVLDIVLWLTLRAKKHVTYVADERGRSAEPGQNARDR